MKKNLSSEEYLKQELKLYIHTSGCIFLETPNSNSLYRVPNQVANRTGIPKTLGDLKKQEFLENIVHTTGVDERKLRSLNHPKWQTKQQKGEKDNREEGEA